MCNFISWFQKGDAVIFLTDNDLATKEGMALRKELGDQFINDIKGHGAIARYFELNEWVLPMDAIRREVGDSRCPDFSTPNNFPPQIVEAIKNCNLTQIGRLPDNVLLSHGLGLIKKDAKREEAYAKWKEAEAKWKEAEAKWEEAEAKWQEAEAKREEAYAKWEEADAKRKEAYANVFWKVFADPKNRKKVWR